MHPNEALFANDAFYLAFAARDLNAMTALWSRQAQILCVHPGWGPLVGHEQVIGSWARILGNPRQPAIECFGAQAVVVERAVVCVYCYERVGDNTMIATNLFVSENGFPRLISHQSGPCADPPADTSERRPPLRVPDA